MTSLLSVISLSGLLVVRILSSAKDPFLKNKCQLFSPFFAKFYVET